MALLILGGDYQAGVSDFGPMSGILQICPTTRALPLGSEGISCGDQLESMHISIGNA